MKNIIEKIVYPLVTCIFETFSLPQALSILVYSLFIKSTIKLFWAKDFSWSTIVKNRFWCCFMLSGFVLQLKFYLVMLCPIMNPNCTSSVLLIIPFTLGEGGPVSGSTLKCLLFAWKIQHLALIHSAAARLFSVLHH